MTGGSDVDPVEEGDLTSAAVLGCLVPGTADRRGAVSGCDRRIACTVKNHRKYETPADVWQQDYDD